MKVVEVKTEGHQYLISIEAGMIDRVGTLVPQDASAIVIVTNPTVDALFGERVRQSLAITGKRIVTVMVPDGEVYKTHETLNIIYDAMLTERFDRKAVLVALGGGVIGDTAGYAAATYMRGIRFIQVPTTLLAQVDSSVGGKTAVNHPKGKNMIGAFYQPIAVAIDPDVLKTLAPREVSAGLAEVIKYGLILDAEFFQWCEENAVALRNLDSELITQAIAKSCELKAYVVSNDEKETGMRAILNLGHTFGHAIEAGLGYGKWLHGEAVGCGMVQAAELSALSSGFDAADVKRVRQLVANIGCPVVAPDLGEQKWFDLMQVDKKNEGGKIKFILMPKIGQAFTQVAALDLVKQAITKTII